MPCSGSRSHREEESLLFAGKHSAIEKSWTPSCCVDCSPLNFLFFSVPRELFSFPSYAGTLIWLTMVLDSKLQFSAVLNQPFLLYLAVYLFKVYIIQVTHTSETSYLIGVHPTKSWRNVETGIVLKLARISQGLRLLAE